jgi:hypothetical protein
MLHVPQANKGTNVMDSELLNLGKQLDAIGQERKALNAAVATGANIEDAHGYAFCNRLHALADDILGRKAQSVAGLAVQTRAINLVAADLWEFDLPHNKSHERRFIEAVCAFVEGII